MLLVDDSIVRGTTSREIVQMARDAGAKKVYMASAAPPVRFPNIYGIDMPTRGELVAGQAPDDCLLEDYERIVKEHILADRVFYQDLGDLTASITEESDLAGAKVASLDNSCFDGVYVTQAEQGGSDRQAEYFANLAEKRGTSRTAVPASAAHQLHVLEAPKRQRQR